MSEPTLFKYEAPAPGLGLQDLIVDLLNSLSAVKALSEISCEMFDEKTLIRYALASLIQNQDMERCSFFAVDNDGMLINVTGLSGAELPENEGSSSRTLRFRIGEGIIGAAASSGEIQHCQDCRDDERFALAGQQSSVAGSIISAPVFTLHNVLIGVLNVSHPQPNYFSDWHLRLLDVYKNMLGQLITNRRLFQQMEELVSQRTADLERLVTETRDLKDHYASISMHDQLTGLHNRRYFYDQVERAIALHKRYQNPFCLLVMDIDHFKRINDQYGHLFGDEVLISVAKTLSQLVRNTDILVRFGGEEFVIIFTNTHCENGKVFAERIRNAIKVLRWQQNSQTVQLTMSIGLHCLSLDCNEDHQLLDIDQLIHRADTALYAAKANGRDQVMVFSEEMLQ